MNVCFPIHLMVTLRRRKGKLREGLCIRAMYRIPWLYLTKPAETFYYFLITLINQFC